METKQWRHNILFQLRSNESLDAVDFCSCLCTLIFHLRKPNDWFAFFVMLTMCVRQLRSSEMVTPMCLAADTLSSSML